MRDSFGRNIDYLRISLTDRCNLRCRYCMPEEGVEKFLHQDILRFEEIKRVIRIFREMGFVKFRFTGGEPLLRRGVFDFLESLPIHNYYITTALAIENLDVARLNQLDLGGLNVSCDSLRPERYRYITRRGDLRIFLSNLQQVRVEKLKINVVVIKDFNEDEIVDFIDFAERSQATVRFIEVMDFSAGDLKFSSLTDIKEELIEKGIIEPKGFQINNSVSEYHSLTGRDGKVGFITPITHHFCRNCDKIRLLSNGEIKLCIFDNKKYNLRELLRNNSDDKYIKDWLTDIIQYKLFKPVMRKSSETMAEIGG
ncbi:MAG: radical SAM protein [Candidatus Auribacterota bacterium]|nr:radical SAM protein [Candidatus Auribacterota bacterium]